MRDTTMACGGQQNDASATLRVRVGIASERGPRPRNDDFAAISRRHDFFALSDGIGGAPYGDVIARIACNAAVEAYGEGLGVEEAFTLANDQASSASHYLGTHSGATLLLAALNGDVLRAAWAGDSVLMLKRGKTLRLLTAPGRVSESSNALDKAIGYGRVEPSLLTERVERGDLLLLCSDGVWEYLPEAEIDEVLGRGPNAVQMADAIARNAASRGRDNATCVVAEIVEVGSARPPAVSLWDWPEEPRTPTLPR